MDKESMIYDEIDQSVWGLGRYNPIVSAHLRRWRSSVLSQDGRVISVPELYMSMIQDVRSHSVELMRQLSSGGELWLTGDLLLVPIDSEGLSTREWYEKLVARLGIEIEINLKVIDLVHRKHASNPPILKLNLDSIYAEVAALEKPLG